MRLHAHCMILMLSLPAAAWASDDPVANRGACVYSGAGDTRGAASDDHAASARTPPAKTGSAVTSGGGGDGDPLVPRMRMPRWHSFLPGMFR